MRQVVKVLRSIALINAPSPLLCIENRCNGYPFDTPTLEAWHRGEKPVDMVIELPEVGDEPVG